MAIIARRIVNTAWPFESCCATPKSGTGAIGITSTTPYTIRSQRERTRRRWGAEGDPAAVLADPHVKRAYLGEEDEVLVDPDDKPAAPECAA